MKHKPFLNASAVFLVLAAASAVTAMADEHQTNTPATPVGPVTASIAQLNYDESGGTVNGFLAGTYLLTFSKSVCGGIGTLGVVGNSVTFSGTTQTSTGIEAVNVTSFTNGTITYPPATTSTKPSAYPATPGTITQINYNPENGAIDGFVFTPTTGPKVFVDIGTPSATLAPLLTVGASVTVTGTLEAPGACAPTGTISEVDASSLTIGSTAYPIGGNH